MSPDELLPTVAQIAVTLAALSGVAGVIGRTSEESLPERELRRVLLRDVAGSGLAAALLSLLPLLLEESWRLLSAAAGVAWVAMFSLSARQLRLMEPARLRQLWVGPLITFVGWALLAWNVVAPGAHSPIRYTAAVLCLLSIAGACFLFAVFIGTRE